MTRKKKSDTGRGYRVSGRCRNCMAPIEAIQPGGTAPRHMQSKIPLEQCPKRGRRH